MNTLFAPWRMEFIEKKPDLHCVFCEMIKGGDDQKAQILHRGKHSYVVMNKFPYSNGHLLVVPYRHEKDWPNLTKEEVLELGEFTQKAVQVLSDILHAEGFNLGVNLGKAAGAGIERHVHQHIVPRWVGDYNFMPLLSEVKVISEHLQTTYRKLLEAWK